MERFSKQKVILFTGNVVSDDTSGRGTGYAINGARAASTNVLLDGSANNGEFDATVGQEVPLDSVQEFRVTTTNANASGTGTITDEAVPGPEDTALVSISGPAAVIEGDTTTPYTVSLSLTPTSDVTVNLSYSGTATDGSDFTGVASVTISAYTSSTTLSLSTLDDALTEGAENLVIFIASVTGGGFEAIAADPAANQVATTITDQLACVNCSYNNLLSNLDCPQNSTTSAESSSSQRMIGSSISLASPSQGQAHKSF